MCVYIWVYTSFVCTCVYGGGGLYLWRPFTRALPPSVRPSPSLSLPLPRYRRNLAVRIAMGSSWQQLPKISANSSKITDCRHLSLSLFLWCWQQIGTSGTDTQTRKHYTRHVLIGTARALYYMLGRNCPISEGETADALASVRQKHSQRERERDRQAQTRRHANTTHTHTQVPKLHAWYMSRQRSAPGGTASQQHGSIEAPTHPHAKAVEKGTSTRVAANVPAAPRARCIDLTACEDEDDDDDEHCAKTPKRFVELSQKVSCLQNTF
jgi:hypothetical protein